MSPSPLRSGAAPSSGTSSSTAYRRRNRSGSRTVCRRCWLAPARSPFVPARRISYGTLTRATKYLTTELQKKGLLDAEVKLAGAEYHADTNRADIHFNITPGDVVKVEIEGAHVWPWTKKSLLPAYQGIGVDQESVAEGQQALASYFQSKGYFDVKVDSHLDQGQKHDTVLYRITKEKKHKVEDVKLTGNSLLHSDQLTPHIAVQEKHFLSAGKFSDDLVKQSVKNLKAVYESEGFSSVTVVPSVINRGGDITVTFRVNEGPRDVVSSLTGGRRGHVSAVPVCARTA